MPFTPLYTKFPCIDTARAHIQRSATSLTDIESWVKSNGWFFVATQLRAHQRVWSEKRQRDFYRTHKNFEIPEFSLVAAIEGLNKFSGYFRTNLTYSHPKLGVRDEISFPDGLSLLGLTGAGSGTSRGSTIEATLHPRLRAQDWLFIATPTILETIGSSIWNDRTSGLLRWFPDADLAKLMLIEQTVGLDENSLIAFANTQSQEKPSNTPLALPPVSFL